MFALRDNQLWRGGRVVPLLMCFNANFGLLSREAPLKRRSALITQAADCFFFSPHEEERQRSDDRDVPLPESPPW